MDIKFDGTPDDSTVVIEYDENNNIVSDAKSLA